MIVWLRDTYLDHNATTPLAPQVCKAMTSALESTSGNPSSLHTKGREARGAVERARSRISSALGCPAEQVFFTSGGTEANNTVIKGVFAAHGKGHIVTTAMEHESILGASRQVEGLGCDVTYLPVGKDGRVRPADVQSALRPDTMLVSVMHANNETGVVQPVSEVAELARAREIPFHVDAVQTFGKIPVRVDQLGCEFLTLTAHKLNGPKGIGALYWRGTQPWHPLVFGGDQERAHRAGTEPVPSIVGFGVATDLAQERMTKERERLKNLRQEFLRGIRELFPSVVVHEASPEHQLPGTLNLAFPGKEGIRLLAGLDCHMVSVSIGSACTADRIEPSHVLLAMGISEKEALSSVRLSMGVTTTARDIRYVLKVFKEVLAGDPEGFKYLDPQHLTPERMRSRSTFLVDLRLPTDRLVEPALPGAKVWSHLQFDSRIKEIPRDKEVILVCGTGLLSLSAGYRLAKAGHKDVKVVYGGYKAWAALGIGR